MQMLKPPPYFKVKLPKLRFIDHVFREALKSGDGVLQHISRFPLGSGQPVGFTQDPLTPDFVHPLSLVRDSGG